MLKAIFFGVPQIYYNQDSLTGTLSGRCLALFAYLALTNRPHDRGHLADLLWSDVGEQQARQNLRYVLYDLRRLVGDYLVVTRHMIAFARQNPHWIDAAIFADYLATKEMLTDPSLLQEFLHLYGDELLAGFSIQNAPVFEEWLTQQRHWFRQQATQGLLHLSNHYLAQRDYSAGLAATQRLLQLEPWQEEAHRNQMCLLAFRGERLAALNQYKVCQQALQAEFSVEPEAATTALYRAIESGRLTPPVHPAPNSKQRSILVNWDAIPPTTPLYGRAEEVARLHQWLIDPQHRLVGLFGLTGQGKSVLATEVITQLAEAATERPSANPFAVILWSSLSTYRTLPQLLDGWLTQLTRPSVAFPVHPPVYLGEQKEIPSPSTLDEPQETVETLLQQLLTQLRRRRVLLIIDSGEMIYSVAGPLTDYQLGWNAFDELLRRLADNEHRSCLLLLSRIPPVAWETLARRSSAVRTLSLAGLSVDASVSLLQAGGRVWAPSVQALAEQCIGHPQTLVTVRELLDSFGLDLLTEPLAAPGLAGSCLRTLQTQFARLGSMEQTILHHLTHLPTAPTAAILWQQMPHAGTMVAYLEAIHTLQRQQWLLPSRPGTPLLLAPLVRRFLEQAPPNTPLQKSRATVKPPVDEGVQLRLRRPSLLEEERSRSMEGQKEKKTEVRYTANSSVRPVGTAEFREGSHETLRLNSNVPTGRVNPLPL